MAEAFVHVSVERQIRESYKYPLDKPTRQFFTDYPDLSFAMCLEMEAKLSAAAAAHNERIRWSEEEKKTEPSGPKRAHRSYKRDDPQKRRVHRRQKRADPRKGEADHGNQRKNGIGKEHALGHARTS
jgi:hypothetical protein